MFTGKEFVPQQKLLIIDLRLKSAKPQKQKFVLQLCRWKLKEENIKN